MIVICSSVIYNNFGPSDSFIKEFFADGRLVDGRIKFMLKIALK